MLVAKLAQRPVGQGGFFVGELKADSDKFRFVYDCGSTQIEPLRREVVRLAGTTIDIVFMSHLDSDHVNGLDMLFATTKVDEVVLPYLNAAERLLLIAQGAATGRISGQLVDFYANPVAWLRRRNVERITLLRGPENPLPPELPAVEPVEPAGKLRAKWSSQPRSQRDGRTQSVANGDPLLVAASNALIDWVFLPQAHRPSAKRVATFANALRLAFGESGLSRIVAKSRTHEGRRILRECYDRLWKDHNLVSMSLFTGPGSATGRSWATETIHGGHYSTWRSDPGLGWLMTGDADLSSRARRNAFLRYYEPILSRVGVLIVPHHGSALSFDQRIMDGMTSLMVGGAAAGANGYGHPHPVVRDAVLLNSDRCFAHISDDVRTGLTSQLKT